MAALFAFCVACAAIGVDFGLHWDEPRHTAPAARWAASGRILPGTYIYPSFCYDLSLATLLARGALGPAWLRGYPRTTPRPGLAAFAQSQEFLLDVRRLCLAITYLSLLWIYLLVSRWRRNPLEALLACALLGLSWQLGYHSRWVAPDALLMQFSALTACLSYAAADGKSRRHLWGAAAAAGAACGTKYPGGLLLAPVLLAAWDARSPESVRMRLLRAGMACAIFASVYLLSTPGTLLESSSFLRDVATDVRVYRTGWGGNTVVPFLEHGPRIAVFLSVSALSPWAPTSIFLAVMAVVGAVELIRTEGRRATLFLCFPVLYALYFSGQRVLFVRNLLVLLPTLAVLSARGCTHVLDRMPLRGRPLLAAVLGGMLCANAFWLAHAAFSVRAPVDQVLAFSRHAAVSSKNGFVLSPRVRRALQERHLPVPAPAAGAGQDSFAVFFLREIIPGRLPANHPGLYRSFGPLDVDVDYYPAWCGPDRIMLMPARLLDPAWFLRSRAGHGPPSARRQFDTIGRYGRLEEPT